MYILLKYTGVGKAGVGSRLDTHHEAPPPQTVQYLTYAPTLPCVLYIIGRGMFFYDEKNI